MSATIQLSGTESESQEYEAKVRVKGQRLKCRQGGSRVSSKERQEENTRVIQESVREN